MRWEITILLISLLISICFNIKLYIDSRNCKCKYFEMSNQYRQLNNKYKTLKNGFDFIRRSCFSEDSIFYKYEPVSYEKRMPNDGSSRERDMMYQVAKREIINSVINDADSIITAEYDQQGNIFYTLKVLKLK